MSAMHYEADTIAAVATPAGTGAVALVRLSGPGSWGVAEAVFRGKGRLAARRVVYGDLVDEEGRIIDDVLVTAFRGPGSYTGEDTVEIACHGGMLVTRRVLELVLRNGARAAEAGEFTRRAFLNGKLDLTQAEAVMDVIGAQSDLALRAAHRQLEGRLGNVLVGLRDELVEVLAHVEAWIDFPEEDIDPDTGAELREKTVRVAEGVERLMATAEQGRLLREGVRTVIAGAPNAGKSSLLNRMLGFERALVSELAGTTRDSIEETINLGGIPVRLVDTAGLRSETADPLEAAGMARTRRELGTADLLMEVVDASQPPAGELEGGESLPVRRLLLLNKADLGVDAGWDGRGGLRVSCRTGEGMDEVVKAVVALIAGVPGEGGDVDAAVNARHLGCLRRAASALRAAEGQLAAEAAPEFTALDLREALEAIGEVTGRTDVEDLLGVIFARFCIGK
jgi:tRNA modification GTPase